MGNSLETMDVIQKATTAVTSLSSGGQLVPEQQREFIRIAIVPSVVMPLFKMPNMVSSTKELPRTRFEGNIMRSGESGRALTEGDTAQPTFGKATLNAKLLRGRVRVNDEVFEENVELEALQATIMALVGEKVGSEMELLTLLGDTANIDDPLLRTFDGIVKQAATHIYAAGGVRLDSSILNAAYLMMPREFRRARKAMKYMTSDAAVAWYGNSIQQRGTPAGDSQLLQGGPEGLVYNGVEVLGVPLMDENEGVDENESSLLFCDPSQVNVGIQRGMAIKTWPDYDAGQQVIAINMKMDAKYEYEPAVVKVTGLKVDSAP